MKDTLLCTSIISKTEVVSLLVDYVYTFCTYVLTIYDFFYRDGPLLVVASGRDTISIASSIKRLASENVFVIQVCC